MAEQSAKNGKTLSIAKGESFRGIYVKTEHNQGEKKNSSIHTFLSYSDQTVETEDKNGPSGKMTVNKHQKVAIWGSTILNELVTSLVPGQYCRIEYLGKVQGKNNAYRDYDMFKDDEIPIMDLRSFTPGAGAEDDEDDSPPAKTAKAEVKKDPVAKEAAAKTTEVAAKNDDDLGDDDLPF